MRRKQMRRKQTHQRRVRGSDDRSAARCSLWRRILNSDRRIASFDAVVGIEDRSVNDGPKPLTRRIRCFRRNESVDEDLIPLQNLVRGAHRTTARASSRSRRHRGGEHKTRRRTPCQQSSISSCGMSLTAPFLVSPYCQLQSGTRARSDALSGVHDRPGPPANQAVKCWTRGRSAHCGGMPLVAVLGQRR